ncbi:MAG: hypothetical protein HWN80_19150 [Candidatus Lokiarchaeota archaeon]|nr:hypothetical protein [Candidatus Lokiarchaeota archaeon]
MGKDKTVKCGFCETIFESPKELRKIKDDFNIKCIVCPNCDAVLGVFYA